MENASKALLIAGSMLIVLLILSLIALVWGRVGGQTANFYEKLQKSDIEEFNQKIAVFEGRGTKKNDSGNWINPLRIHDVVTLINIGCKFINLMQFIFMFEKVN